MSDVGDHGEDAVHEAGAAASRREILIIVGVVICVGAFADLVGWDIRAWFKDLWDTLTSISVEYIIAAVVAMIVRRRRRRFAWYSILPLRLPRRGALNAGVRRLRGLCGDGTTSSPRTSARS